MEEAPSIHDYKEVIAITKDNVERLTALIQDLLHFNAELDSTTLGCIETEKLFKKITEDLSAAISKKNISLHIMGTTKINGDRDLLERAFFNLIQNAVKYNKENGAMHIISDGDTITIADTGIGIPEECLPLIFEPFYCVDKSRSRKLGGSGLGLSITKQIFDKHALALSVSSTLGAGTTFVIKRSARS